MKKGKIKISVAGVRGIYPDEINSNLAFRFAFAFGNYGKGKEFLTGRDTRESGDVLTSSVISGILSAGKNVTDLGIIPTPLMEFIIEKVKKSYGVLITASHNPLEYNGLKFLNKKGNFLNENDWKEFLTILKNIEKKEFSKKPGKLKTSQIDYTDIYFQTIYKSVNIKKIRSKKFKVVVDTCQGVSSFYTEQFLKDMGCEVIVFNTFPPGKFSHNPEPTVKNLKYLKRKVIEEKADIGFMQDPDCDRLAFVCENGYIPGEEITLVVCLDSILSKEKTPVVVNLSTTSLIDYICEKHNVKIFRTKVGEINVVEKMRRIKSRAGGEGNGGVIWGKVHYGRDSFVGMSLILEKMAEENRKISEIIKDYPEYSMIKEKIKIKDKNKFMEKIKSIYKNEKIDLTDGVKILRKDGWIHIRPSGTEPVIRIIVEAETEKTAQKYLSEIYSHIGKF